MLDTNAVIALLAGRPSVVARLRREAPQHVVLSSIVTHELFYGAYKSRRRDQNLARIEALRFEVLDFTAGDARRAGVIRADLAAVGQPIGPYDALTAGQALRNRLMLVTRNTREFARVTGLDIKDWEF